MTVQCTGQYVVAGKSNRQYVVECQGNRQCVVAGQGSGQYAGASQGSGQNVVAAQAVCTGRTEQYVVAGWVVCRCRLGQRAVFNDR